MQIGRYTENTHGSVQHRVLFGGWVVRSQFSTVLQGDFTPWSTGSGCCAPGTTQRTEMCPSRFLLVLQCNHLGHLVIPAISGGILRTNCMAFRADLRPTHDARWPGIRGVDQAPDTNAAAVARKAAAQIQTSLDLVYHCNASLELLAEVSTWHVLLRSLMHVSGPIHDHCQHHPCYIGCRLGSAATTSLCVALCCVQAMHLQR